MVNVEREFEFNPDLKEFPRTLLTSTGFIIICTLMGYLAGTYGQTLQAGIFGGLLGLAGGFTCAFGKNIVCEDPFRFHSKLLLLFTIMFFSAVLAGWYGAYTAMGFSEGFSFGLRAGFLCGLTVIIYFPTASWCFLGTLFFFLPGCIIGMIVGGLATQDWGAGASSGGFIGLVVAFCVFLVFLIGVFDEQISPHWMRIQKSSMPVAFSLPFPILSIFIILIGIILQSLISSLLIVHVCVLAMVWISYVGASIGVSNPRKDNTAVKVEDEKLSAAVLKRKKMAYCSKCGYLCKISWGACPVCSTPISRP